MMLEFPTSTEQLNEFLRRLAGITSVALLAASLMPRGADAASLAAASTVSCTIIKDTKLESEIDLNFKVDLAKREAETASGPTQFFFAETLDASICNNPSGGIGNNWLVFIDIVLGSSLFANDDIFISGIYQHNVAPHNGETVPNFVEFGSPGAFDSTVGAVTYRASDTAAGLGLPLPVFNSKETHPGGNHEDIFSIRMTPTRRLIRQQVANDRYYFEELSFKFAALHPVPIGAGFWFLLSGLGAFLLVGRTQQGT